MDLVRNHTVETAIKLLAYLIEAENCDPDLFLHKIIDGFEERKSRMEQELEKWPLTSVFSI